MSELDASENERLVPLFETFGRAGVLALGAIGVLKRNALFFFCNAGFAAAIPA